MSDNIKKIVLIGAGYMASEYCKVLNGMNLKPLVVGRGEENIKKIKSEYDVECLTGGLDLNIDEIIGYQYAIVSTSVTSLYSNTVSLINIGIKNILVEKPAGLTLDQIEKIACLAKEKDINVYIAYNRRYYSSVIRAKELIELDGGIKSFNFEFTEWSHVIDGTDNSVEDKKHWFYTNSSHVIDMAFYLGGKPKELASFVAGENVIKWHSNCCIYAGAGITENGALFNYSANWKSPGRWSVEILTDKHRYIFRPLEKLQIQDIGKVTFEEDISYDSSLDNKYKPGLYRQVESFLKDEDDGIKKTIYEQVEFFKLLKKIELNEIR